MVYTGGRRAPLWVIEACRRDKSIGEAVTWPIGIIQRLTKQPDTTCEQAGSRYAKHFRRRRGERWKHERECTDRNVLRKSLRGREELADFSAYCGQFLSLEGQRGKDAWEIGPARKSRVAQ